MPFCCRNGVIELRITKMGIILKEDYTAKLVKEYGRNYRGEEKINGARGIVQLMNDVFEMDRQKNICT